MCNYYMRGTIKICVNEGKPNLKIKMSPYAGFLTPDEPSKKAIALPIKAKSHEAKLLKLVENEFVCKAKITKDYLPALTSIAAQQKLVELYLKISKNKSPKIIGFVFPVK